MSELRVSAQHDIGEHPDEFVVALHRFARFNLRGGCTGRGRVVEQERKSLRHAMEP